MMPDNEANAVGRYANYLSIGHNAFEFVFDFGHLYERGGASPMHTRVVTTPVYAKAMLEALRRSLEDFEVTHGAVPTVAGPE